MKHSIAKRFLGVSVYAIAMAYLEAAVVVYLRALLGLKDITAVDVSLGPYGLVEIGREAATIAMLVAVGWMAGRHAKERWAYGLFAFGLWDIFYYVWLKVLLDWPASLLGWDLLFLIPLPWWGPVLAPVLIAALICVVAVLAVVRMAGSRWGSHPFGLPPRWEGRCWRCTWLWRLRSGWCWVDRSTGGRCARRRSGGRCSWWRWG
jgi:hypothetical protein